MRHEAYAFLMAGMKPGLFFLYLRVPSIDHSLQLSQTLRGCKLKGPSQLRHLSGTGPVLDKVPAGRSLRFGQKSTRMTMFPWLRLVWGPNQVECPDIGERLFSESIAICNATLRLGV